MKIEFTVRKQSQTAHKFCKYLIRWIKHDMKSKRNKESLQLRLDLLPYAAWVQWMGSPIPIQADRFISLAAECVCYTVRKNTFLIYIDENAVLPGSYTSISKIMRYLDYGNELISGTMYFTSIFLKYQKVVADLWFAYKVRAQSY